MLDLRQTIVMLKIITSLLVSVLLSGSVVAQKEQLQQYRVVISPMAQLDDSLHGLLKRKMETQLKGVKALSNSKSTALVLFTDYKVVKRSTSVGKKQESEVVLAIRIHALDLLSKKVNNSLDIEVSGTGNDDYSSQIDAISTIVINQSKLAKFFEKSWAVSVDNYTENCLLIQEKSREGHNGMIGAPQILKYYNVPEECQACRLEMAREIIQALDQYESILCDYYSGLLTERIESNDKGGVTETFKKMTLMQGCGEGIDEEQSKKLTSFVPTKEQLIETGIEKRSRLNENIPEFYDLLLEHLKHIEVAEFNEDPANELQAQELALQIVQEFELKESEEGEQKESSNVPSLQATPEPK
jgi:hypothetical protein